MLLCTGEGTAILPLQKYNRTSFPGQVSNRCEYSTPHYSQEDVRTPECRACLWLSKGQLQLPPLHTASTFHLRPPHLCQENPIHSGVEVCSGTSQLATPVRVWSPLSPKPKQQRQQTNLQLFCEGPMEDTNLPPVAVTGWKRTHQRAAGGAWGTCTWITKGWPH